MTELAVSKGEKVAPTRGYAARLHAISFPKNGRSAETDPPRRRSKQHWPHAAFSWRIPQSSPSKPLCIHFYRVTHWSLTLRRLSSEARI
jgi:hypothetical protein